MTETTSTCAVRGCDSRTEETFTVLAGGENGVAMQWRVCHFHGLALNAGEAFEADGRSHEIVLGSDTVPSIVNILIEQNGINDSLVTLVLGHDKIESSRVTFRMSEADAQEIYDWIGPTKD